MKMSLNNQGINLKPVDSCNKCAFLYKPKKGCFLTLISPYIPCGGEYSKNPHDIFLL